MTHFERNILNGLCGQGFVWMFLQGHSGHNQTCPVRKGSSHSSLPAQGYPHSTWICTLWLAQDQGHSFELCDFQTVNKHFVL